MSSDRRNIPTGCEDYLDYELANAREYLQARRELWRMRFDEMAEAAEEDEDPEDE